MATDGVSGFELCFDNDERGDTTTFVTSGHITTPTLDNQRDLMRAIAYECDRSGLAALVRSARWSQGYVGKVDGVYDLLACDENGLGTGRCGDDGQELVASNVRPVTWATVDS